MRPVASRRGFPNALPARRSGHVDAVGARAAVLEPRERGVAARVDGERGAGDRVGPRAADRPQPAEAPADRAEAHAEPRLRRAAAPRGDQREQSAALPVGLEPGDGRERPVHARRRHDRERRAEAARAGRAAGALEAGAAAVAEALLEPPRRERAAVARDDQARVVDERVRGSHVLAGPGRVGGWCQQQQGKEGEGEPHAAQTRAGASSCAANVQLLALGANNCTLGVRTGGRAGRPGPGPGRGRGGARRARRAARRPSPAGRAGAR